MLRSLGDLGSALVALSFLGLGAGSLAAPGSLAETYGLPVADATGVAFIRAIGMRDAVLGLAVAAFLIRGDREPLRTLIGLSSIVGASDFTIVAARRGTTAPLSLAIHGTGTIGLLGLWLLLGAER